MSEKTRFILAAVLAVGMECSLIAVRRVHDNCNPNRWRCA